MMRLQGLWAIVVLLSLSGCVTAREYNARLADIDGLKAGVASLEERVREKESEKAAVASDLATLREKQARLQKEYDEQAKRNQAAEDDNADLRIQNQILADDNTNLSNLLKAKKNELRVTITELRRKLSELENELHAKLAELETLKSQTAALTQERNALIEEKDSLNREKEAALVDLVPKELDKTAEGIAK